jgi:peptidoglycan-N-acetylglucosamine deacetylase
MSENSHLLGRVARAVRRRVFGTITRVSTSRKAVALTFDDGPSPDATPRLLDLLGEFGAKGTFFVVGQQAGSYPHVLSRIIEEGHGIGNHTWDHPSFPSIGMGHRREQLRACSQAIAPHRTSLFRPPYGYQSIASYLDAAFLGYRVIGWDIAAEDWLGHSGEFMADTVVSRMSPGSIILFHDNLFTFSDAKYLDRKPTLDAVRIIVQRLHGQYEFVTVQELLTCGREQRADWRIPADEARLAEMKKSEMN